MCYVTFVHRGCNTSLIPFFNVSRIASVVIASISVFDATLKVRSNAHCLKSVQIRSNFWFVFSPNEAKNGPEITPYLDTFHLSVFSPNARKYGPEITSYLDTFHAVGMSPDAKIMHSWIVKKNYSFEWKLNLLMSLSLWKFIKFWLYFSRIFILINSLLEESSRKQVIVLLINNKSITNFDEEPYSETTALLDIPCKSLT